MKNISILDPGLDSLRGHHLDQNFRLAVALQKLGHRVQMHCHQSTNEEVETAFGNIGIQISRTFRIHTYDPAPPGNDDLEFWLSLSRKTEEDLSNLAHADIAFWPSLSPIQILAMGRQPYGQKIFGGLDGNINPLTSWGAELIARSVKILRQAGSRVVLGVYDSRMADIYGPLLPEIKILRFPVPYDHSSCAKQPSQKLTRIGFFGYQRGERGKALLPHLAKELIQRGKSVIIHDSGAGFSLKGAHPKNLTILGFVEDISSHIAACDLIVWPSNPSNYLTKTSGIVWNAIAAGVPVALPALCLPARIAHENGAAVFFTQHSVASILEAIAQAEENYPALLERALQKSINWASIEGVSRLAIALTSDKPYQLNPAC